VAAPVFKRIAEQVLPYLEIPRDVPLNPRLIQAAYKHQEETDESSAEDFTATDFNAQLDDQTVDVPMAAQAVERKPQSAEVMMDVDEAADITVPDFAGRTMREVTEMCLHLGLDPVLVGSNLATEQLPAAGTKVKRGARITVQFGTPPPQKAARWMSSAKPHKSSRR
jgi:beta-lactam-binding protein with PASTA domain